MTNVLSITMIKLLTLLLVFLPVLLAFQVHDSHPHHASRMVHQRRSFMSWLTRISSKTSDWMFGSVPIPTVDKNQIPHPAVGGVSVLQKLPYPYVTGMIPRLASETLSGNGLPGGWMCLHVTPPVDAGEGAGGRQRGASGGGQGGVTGAAGQNAPGSGTAGSQSGGAGGAGAGAGAGGMTGGIGGGSGFDGAGGGAGGFSGGQQAMGGAGFQGGNGGGSVYPSGRQGFGTSNGFMGGVVGAGMGGGNGMGSSGMGSGGMLGNGMAGNGMVGNGMVGNGMAGNGMGGNGMVSVGAGGYPMGSNSMGSGYPQTGGMSNGFGAGPGAGMGSDGTGAGAGDGMSGYPGSSGAAVENRGNTVPSGYIRYNGQLMTIDQYQQALAGGSSSGPSSDSQSLSRRDVLQPDSSSIFIHKRQVAPSDGAPQPSSDDDGPPARKGKTAVAKVLMCINGDPAVPPIKFNTMTGMRLRDASVPKDGVVDITNLPNYKMPWMPFLPTAEMWAEQQELMLAQEQMIETNMTTAPPPSR